MSLVKTESKGSNIKSYNKQTTSTDEDIHVEMLKTREECEEIITSETKAVTSKKEVVKQRKIRHQHSHSSRREKERESNFDIHKGFASDRSSPSPTSKKNNFKPKNFLVRVFANGDLSRCAYCASCSMNIILSEASRKLSLVRRAERLFDSHGREIFQSEDIERGQDYFVSCGENYISSTKAIKRHLLYRKHTVWTMEGIKFALRKSPRRRVPSSDYSSSRSSSSSSGSSSTSSSIICFKRSPIRRKKARQKKLPKKPRRRPKSTQTDKILSLPLPPERTCQHAKTVHTQTNERLQPKLQAAYTQTVEERPPSPQEEIERKETEEERSPSPEVADDHTQTDNYTLTLSPKVDCHDESTSIDQNLRPENISIETQTMWNRLGKATQTGEGVQPRVTSANPIYRRPNRTTNFRVKVYPNGDRSRHAFCKTCSMDIFLLAATDKLQLSKQAKRIFDSEGKEIFHVEEMDREEEYYVSTGANFKMPPD